MTDLEIMQRAKVYIDKLANGINPLDNTAIPEGEVVNQIKVSRCLFYVSDVLRKTIENEETALKKRKQESKVPFVPSEEIYANFKYSEIPIPVSEIAGRINEFKQNANMKNCQYTMIMKWLLKNGAVEEISTETGKSKKRPTAKGKQIGIGLEERTGKNGVYHVVVYDKQAQKYIIDNLENIVRDAQTNEEKNQQAQ